MAEAAVRREILYGFAAAHVQEYLLASPRLRHIEGASQRLEQLCGPVFSAARRACGLGDDGVVLSQAAGGARILSDAVEAVRTLHAVWPMIADRFAPGVVLQQAMVELETEAGGDLRRAQRQLGERLRGARTARLADLPAVGPMVCRDVATGLPAEHEWLRRGHASGDARRSVLVDRSTWVKECTHCETMRRGVSELDRRFLGSLDARFEVDELGSREAPYVALIHADGNGIGELVSRMLDGAQRPARELLRAFSGGLKAATESAAQTATKKLPVNDRGRLPARPIVLGGDDLTILVEARHALPFTRTFLKAFEHETMRRLGDLGIPDFRGLSACAGLAVVKHNFPFDRAHELAESLCGQAKRHAKRGCSSALLVPSALSFHRVTTSLPQDATTVLEKELTGPAGRLTFEAWHVGDKPAGDLADLSDLEALATALPYGEARGALRNLVATMYGSRVAADEAFARLKEVLERSRRDGGGSRARLIDDRLAVLTGGGLWRTREGQCATPIFDAYVLRLLQGKTVKASR